MMDLLTIADMTKFLYRNPRRSKRFPSNSRKSPSCVTSPPTDLYRNIIC